MIGEINGRLGPDNAICHAERKYLNNRIESDHAALKQRLRPMRRFQTLAGAKAALAGFETFRTIRKGQFENCETGVINEITFIAKLFQEAALQASKADDKHSPLPLMQRPLRQTDKTAAYSGSTRRGALQNIVESFPRRRWHNSEAANGILFPD